MKAYLLPLDCPACGGEVEHVTSSSSGTDGIGVVGCPACGVQWYVAVQLRRLGKVQHAKARA